MGASREVLGRARVTQTLALLLNPGRLEEVVPCRDLRVVGRLTILEQMRTPQRACGPLG